MILSATASTADENESYNTFESNLSQMNAIGQPGSPVQFLLPGIFIWAEDISLPTPHCNLRNSPKTHLSTITRTLLYCHLCITASHTNVRVFCLTLRLNIMSWHLDAPVYNSLQAEHESNKTTKINFVLLKTLQNSQSYYLFTAHTHTHHEWFVQNVIVITPIFFFVSSLFFSSI